MNMDVKINKGGWVGGHGRGERRHEAGVCTRLNPCEEIFSLVCTRILP